MFDFIVLMNGLYFINLVFHFDDERVGMYVIFPLTYFVIQLWLFSVYMK